MRKVKGLCVRVDARTYANISQLRTHIPLAVRLVLRKPAV